MVFTSHVMKPKNHNYSINIVTNKDMIDDKHINNCAKNRFLLFFIRVLFGEVFYPYL